jgi:copper resistance protein D
VVFWLTLIVHWLHVVAGTLWLGGAIFFDLIVAPVADAVPLQQRRDLGRRLGARVGPYLATAGGVTLLLGILRGTLFGPITDLSMLGTAYGITWLVALICTIGLAVVSGRVFGPLAERVYGDDDLWRTGPDGQPSSALIAAVRHMSIISRLQIAAFAVIITCMVLMHFGL